MALHNFTVWRTAGAAALCFCALPALAQQFGIVGRMGGIMSTEPSFFSSVVATVPRGEKLEFISRDGSFWKVRWGGKEGWMSRALIDKVDAAAPTAAAPTAAAPTAAAPTAAAPTAAAPTAAAPTAAAPTAAAPAPAAPVDAPAASAAIAPAAALPTPPTPVPATPPAPAVSAQATAPRPPQPTATALATVAPAKASSRGRAVIFGISQYVPNRPDLRPLLGVRKDLDSAIAMAEMMGIAQDRISVYSDTENTKASMTAVLTQLAREITEDETVLVYYSGHGGRAADPTVAGRCLEGLITYDGDFLTSAEMSRLLQPLAKTTDGLFVFIDACHSGGLASTRAVTGTQGGLTPKFAASGNVSNCGEIVNMLQPPPGTRATGNRYIYTAAAQANEVSLDDSRTGGLATSNFVRCMASNRSATLNVDELRDCAQQGINKYLEGSRFYKPHQMTVTGDLSRRPVRGDISPALKAQLLASAAQGQLSTRPSTAKAAYISGALSSQGWPAIFSPQTAFAAVRDRADTTTVLKVEAPSTLKIDAETLSMKVQAPSDGFVYIFQATGDGKSAVLLFPNTADRDHRLRAGQSLELPRPSWPLVAGGPEGDNQILVVFSKTERDIGQLVGQEAGPFLDLAVSPTGMQALALAVSRSAYADDADCKGAASTQPAYCSAGFSAQVKTIREVR